MTSLRLGIYRPGPDGVALPAVGGVLLTPHARRTTAPTEPTDVVLPDRLVVELPEGRTVDPVVELEPGYWQVAEHVRAGASYLVMVPDVPEVVDLADLPWIDPATLAPAAVPEAAWWAALEQGAYGVAAAVDPTDADVLLLRFPAWRSDPGDPLTLLMPVLTGA